MEVVKINMIIGDHQELIQLSVMNLGNHNLFLGYDWLQKHNLSIDWRDSSISLKNCWQWCRKIYIPEEPEKVEKDVEEEMIEDGEKVLFVNLEEEAWRREELNIRSAKIEEKEEDIPRKYEDFNDRVFNKAVFEKLLD